MPPSEPPPAPRPASRREPIRPSVAHPGWYDWTIGSAEQFNRAVLGPIIARREASGAVRVRLLHTPERVANYAGTIHGGVLMAFTDTAIFAASVLHAEHREIEGVTLDCQTQFLAPGRLGEPVDAVVEIARETGRLIFLRGILEQGETAICSFTGIIRKAF